MPAPGPPWQEWEDAFVRDLSLSRAEVVARTGRSLWAVKTRSAELGVDRTFRGRAALCPGSDDPWCSYEYEVLWDVSKSLREVSRIVGRSYPAVLHKASREGVGGRASSNEVYSSQEILVIKDITLSLDEVAERLGRTYGSVKKVASQLGVSRQFGQDYRTGYRGPDWPQVRLEVLERDGYTCQDGGEFIPSGSGLAVHHKIPWHLRESNDPRWLVTLCTSHHMRRPEHRWTEIPDHILLQLGADWQEVNCPPESPASPAWGWR